MKSPMLACTSLSNPHPNSRELYGETERSETPHAVSLHPSNSKSFALPLFSIFLSPFPPFSLPRTSNVARMESGKRSSRIPLYSIRVTALANKSPVAPGASHTRRAAASPPAPLLPSAPARRPGNRRPGQRAACGLEAAVGQSRTGGDQFRAGSDRRDHLSAAQTGARGLQPGDRHLH